MFDIGFPELLIVALVLLLVVGPERLPEVLRTVGRVAGSARRPGRWTRRGGHFRPNIKFRHCPLSQVRKIINRTR